LAVEQLDIAVLAEILGKHCLNVVDVLLEFFAYRGKPFQLRSSLV
jgi:hypothetical protein